MNIKYFYIIVLVLGVNLKLSAQQQIITPSEAVSMALDNNYGIKVANNSVKIADNNADILNSGYLPTLDGRAGANYNVNNREVEFSSGPAQTFNGVESSSYNASVNLNYTIFDGLGRSYNYRQLKEQYELSEIEARETIENTIIQLFSVYYNVAQLIENTDAIKQTLDISKDRLIRADYQFEYGQSTKLGVLNAEVDINNDSVSLINAKQQLKNFKRDLNVVTGNVLPEDFNVKTDISFILGLNKQSLYEKTLANNVSLLQTEKNIVISEYDIKFGKSAYLPTVGLSGNYGWNKNNNGPGSFAIGSVSTGFSAGLNLSWNLFDGGTTITRVKNAKINLENQKLLKEQLIVDITRNFNNAWDDYQNKLEIYRIQVDNIITAQNNFDRTKEKFSIGQVNSIEFRQAQLNLLNAELSRNQAKYEAKLAELQVLQISGELLNISFD